MKAYRFFPPVFLILSFCLAAAPAQVHQPQIFEEDIRNFQEADRENPPSPGGVLFLGSSSIRMWALEQWFPGLDALNRGYGGSYISDSIFYADRILLPYRPRSVIFYAGDNDLADGKNPEKVFLDYRDMAGIILTNLPETDFVFISIKPSISRWELIEEIRLVNGWIQEFCRGNPRLHFLDIEKAMLTERGKPDPSLFLEDGLHLNEKGYRIWTEMLRPLLE